MRIDGGGAAGGEPRHESAFLSTRLRGWRSLSLASFSAKSLDRRALEINNHYQYQRRGAGGQRMPDHCVCVAGNFGGLERAHDSTPRGVIPTEGMLAVGSASPVISAQAADPADERMTGVSIHSETWGLGEAFRTGERTPAVRRRPAGPGHGERRGSCGASRTLRTPFPGRGWETNEVYDRAKPLPCNGLGGPE